MRDRVIYDHVGVDYEIVWDVVCDKVSMLKAELERIRESARATAIKNQRINIRLSSGDLRDIQVKAMQEGIPYRTLIASVLHKYVTGRLSEKSSGAQSGPNGVA